MARRPTLGLGFSCSGEGGTWVKFQPDRPVSLREGPLLVVFNSENSRSSETIWARQIRSILANATLGTTRDCSRITPGNIMPRRSGIINDDNGAEAISRITKNSSSPLESTKEEENAWSDVRGDQKKAGSWTWSRWGCLWSPILLIYIDEIDWIENRTWNRNVCKSACFVWSAWSLNTLKWISVRTCISIMRWSWLGPAVCPICFESQWRLAIHTALEKASPSFEGQNSKTFFGRPAIRHGQLKYGVGPYFPCLEVRAVRNLLPPVSNYFKWKSFASGQSPVLPTSRLADRGSIREVHVPRGTEVYRVTGQNLDFSFSSGKALYSGYHPS